MRDASRRRVVLGAVVACVLLAYAVTRAQTPGPPKTYTCTWTHDGTADSYQVLVDGVMATMSPREACTGTPPTVSCVAPVTMTTNVPHVVTVRAVNLFGEATSDPFSAAPPAKPAVVGVR